MGTTLPALQINLPPATHGTLLGRHACLFSAFDKLFGFLTLNYLYLINCARITHTAMGSHHLDLHSLCVHACTPTHTMHMLHASHVVIDVDTLTIEL